MSEILQQIGVQRQLRVFLCHASADKPAVRAIYHRLKADGFAPWLDEENLLPGQDWQEEIPTAVRACDVVLVFLSHVSISKEGYLQREIRDVIFVEEEKPEGTIFIIPVRLQEVVVPRRLSRWQYADLFQEDGYGLLTGALKARASALGLAVVPSYRSSNEDGRSQGAKPCATKTKNVDFVARTQWRIGSAFGRYKKFWYIVPIAIAVVVMLLQTRSRWSDIVVLSRSDNLVTTWGVIFGADTSLEGAQYETRMIAPRLGISGASIYFRHGRYVSIATTADKTLADQILKQAQQRRSDAYIVDMAKWCPHRSEKEGYISCADP